MHDSCFVLLFSSLLLLWRNRERVFHVKERLYHYGLLVPSPHLDLASDYRHLLDSIELMVLAIEFEWLFQETTVPIVHFDYDDSIRVVVAIGRFVGDWRRMIHRESSWGNYSL